MWGYCWEANLTLQASVTIDLDPFDVAVAINKCAEHLKMYIPTDSAVFVDLGFQVLEHKNGTPCNSKAALQRHST